MSDKKPTYEELEQQVIESRNEIERLRIAAVQQNKSESVLWTRDSTAALKLQDIVNIEQFQMLQDRLNKINSFPSAIIDNDGNILTATAWQDVCIKFNRQNPLTEKECIKSDQYILSHLHEANPAVSYKCPHGLVDNAMPIIIDGVHYANFFTGQFFLEPPDLLFFRDQARKYGFNEDEYIEAVKKVPVWSEEQLGHYLIFIKGMIDVISEVGIKRIKEIETGKQLLDSNEFNQQIIASALDGIIVYDSDLRYKVWNPQMEKISGVAAEKVLGMHPLEVFPFMKEAGMYERLERILKGEQLESTFFQYIFPNSEKTIWVENTSSALRNFEGKIIGVIGIVRDITSRKISEEMMVKSEQRYKSTVNALSDFLHVIDKDMNIVMKNEAMTTICRNFNLQEDIEGKYLFDAFPFLSKEILKEYENVFATGKVLVTEECNVIDGNKVYTETRKIPTFNNNEIDSIVTVIRDITERNNAEEKLFKTQKMLNDTEKMAKIGGWELDIKTLETIWTEAVYEIHEVDFSHRTNVSNGISFYTPESRPIIENAVQNAIKYGDTFDEELEIVTAKGNTRYVHTFGKADLENGKVIGTFQDITERKKTEKALMESQERLSLAINGANLGLWDWSVKTGKVVFSDKWVNMIGYEKDELESTVKTWEDLLHPEDREKTLQRLTRHFEDQKSEYSVEFRMRCKSGDWKWILACGKVVERDESGNPVRMTGTHLDINERKKAEEALRESEERYRLINDASLDQIYSYDLENRFTSANRQLCANLGRTADEVVGKSYWELGFPESNCREWDELHRKVYATGSNVEIVSTPMPDGTTHYFEVNLSLVHDDAGEVIGIAGVNRDITEQKKAEDSQQRFQEQEKHAVVGKVAGKMAHDFNNVLGIIMGTSQLLQTEDLPKEMQTDVDIILESAKKGRDLTKNLLFFAKDQEVKLSQFDFREKIDMVIRSLKSELNDIEVNTSYGSNMEKLLADAGLLENALINMIQNSIHAMSKTANPKLNIKTYTDKNNICIEIEDNGCGIPEEWKDKIYDPTVSLKGSGDRTGAYSSGIKGSGYGMANVKRCVDKHGGTISFTSEVDKGTKFKITLPLIEGHFSNEEIETIQKQHAVGEKRILIVEDEPHFGRILYSLLEKFNHNVALATDGKMALNHIEHNTYDAISLDYILPDMTGMDVYRKIRETNKEIPVIFVSGNFEFMQSMIDLKKEDPNVDYLAKPFDNVEYVNKLHQWLPEKG